MLTGLDGAGGRTDGVSIETVPREGNVVKSNALCKPPLNH